MPLHLVAAALDLSKQILYHRTNASQGPREGSASKLGLGFVLKLRLPSGSIASVLQHLQSNPGA